MKRLVRCICVAMLGVAVALATDVPARSADEMQRHPGFDRDVIPGGGGGAAVERPPPPGQRVTTYITLLPEREWTHVDGRTIRARLIAFEDHVVEVAHDEEAGREATPPAGRPTVVKDGKVRLLVGGRQPSEISLDLLSKEDQEEVARVKTAVENLPVPGRPGDGE